MFFFHFSLPHVPSGHVDVEAPVVLMQTLFPATVRKNATLSTFPPKSAFLNGVMEDLLNVPIFAPAPVRIRED